MGLKVTKIYSNQDTNCSGCKKKLTIFNYNENSGLKLTIYNQEHKIIGCMFFQKDDNNCYQGKCPNCLTSYQVKT